MDDPKSLYPALSVNDEALLQEIFSLLSRSVSPLANPYGDDGSYVASIRSLPDGLRAMAATHHLDISLTLDDIGWHFLNFGEHQFVRETEMGLRELGLDDMAQWFSEAFAILDPLRLEIASGEEYDDCLVRHGKMDRIDELTRKARSKRGTSRIYDAWVRYTRQYPEKVFGEPLLDSSAKPPTS